MMQKATTILENYFKKPIHTYTMLPKRLYTAKILVIKLYFCAVSFNLHQHIVKKGLEKFILVSLRLHKKDALFLSCLPSCDYAQSPILIEKYKTNSAYNQDLVHSVHPNVAKKRTRFKAYPTMEFEQLPRTKGERLLSSDVKSVMFWFGV